MRLWHKDLIPVLPKRQLVAQWRECCCIAKNIAEIGTPNHLLVNKVLDYPSGHFDAYTLLVIDEMKKRGYKINKKSYDNYCANMSKAAIYFNSWNPVTELFKGWHNNRYLTQCKYNLQEKFDCGGMMDSEWCTIQEYYTGKECGYDN